VVPVSALRHGNTGDFVFVLNQDRTVTQRPVKAGQATVDKVQIDQRPAAGRERVVTEGADRLKEGAASRCRRRAAHAGRGRRRPAAPQGASAAGPSDIAALRAAGTPPVAAAAGRDRPARRRLRPARALAPAPNVAAARPAAGTPPSNGPTPEQRRASSTRSKDDPEQLARRKGFSEKIDQRDPAALSAGSG
jgi:multidrug efflux system membrane fusion protein